MQCLFSKKTFRVSTKGNLVSLSFTILIFNLSIKSPIMTLQQRINELFEKYLNKECSPSEWEELLVLVSGIEENDTETLSEPLFKLWEQVRLRALPSQSHLADREKIYAAVIASGRKDTGTSSPLRFTKWLRIAAAAALIGALPVAGIYFIAHKKADNVVAVATTSPDQLPPGINKAVLTLSDGSRVILDSTVAGATYAQGKTTVVNMAGKLIYHPAENEKEIRYNEVATAKANQYQLVLPDGSKVWLNAVSSLHFPTAFTGRDRTVELTGEAYFEVTKNPAMPFSVKVNGTEVKVLGTHFNINAYPDEAELKTSLLEGSVNIISHGKSEVLTPGQEASVKKDGELKTGPGNVEMAVAWKNGYFQFDQASLPVIMRQIARWYNLEVTFAGRVPDRLFKGKIQRSLPLSGILNLLQKGDVHFKLNGQTLTVFE